MKTTLFIGITLLITPQLLRAQYQGQTVTLDPAQPKPGQTITVTYNPVGTKLVGASAIDGIVYWLRPKGEPIAQGFMPAKAGSFYRSTITVPDTISGLAVVFEQGKVKDNNQNKTYAFLLYGSDGKPKSGSYASLSRIYSSTFYYVGGEERDAKTAMWLMQQEIALNPQAKRQYMTDYLAAFDRADEADRKGLQAELETCAGLTDLTKDEMEWISHLYQELGKGELAEAMTKRSDEKFGKTVDLMKAFTTFYRERTTLAQKKTDYAQLKQEVAKSKNAQMASNMPYMHSAYLKMLADSSQWNDFYSLIKEAPADYKIGTMDAYNSIAWDWAEKGKNLEKAAELSKEATEWAKNTINAPRSASDQLWQTDKQLQKVRQSMYSAFADTYGYILLQQGKTDQAVHYLKEAVKRSNNEVTGYNERYIKALAQVDPAAVVQEAGLLISENKSSKEIEEAFKAAYLKNHPGESGANTYLAELKKKGTERQKAELREKLISRPAPAFSLMNLDGKTVRLADLKGKTVIADFWATWCGPCIASFPGMQKAVEKFRSNPNVAFVFINCRQTETDKKKNAADFIAKKGYTFDVLLDETNEVYTTFGVAGIPTKFIIDKTGVIRFKSVGFMGNSDALADEISMMIDLANEPVN